jgi:hypothetical protein
MNSRSAKNDANANRVTMPAQPNANAMANTTTIVHHAFVRAFKLSMTPRCASDFARSAQDRSDHGRDHQQRDDPGKHREQAGVDGHA